MTKNFKENLIDLDGKKITFHEFEQKLLKNEFTGNEMIYSEILTAGETKKLKDTRLWEIVQKILSEIKNNDEFSERLRIEIEKIIKWDI